MPARPTVVLVGALDTKGREYGFVRDRLRDAGCDVVLVDTGVLGDPPVVPDVSAAEVARAAGVELGDLRFDREGSDKRALALATMERGRALAAVRDEEAFADVITAFTRAANLAGKAAAPGAASPEAGPPPAVDPALFQEEVEGRLLEVYNDVAAEALAMEKEERFPDFFRSLSRLRPAVDAFFDGVLVMADDPAVRENRLNLLRHVSELATRVADLSKLVTTK